MTKTNDTKPRAHADGIPVYCAYDEIVPIGQLRPNPKNPNKHPQDQLEKLGKIIRGNGWRNPITVSTRSGLIVKGHGRLLTAELEELKEVPVEYQNYESEEAELADLTADNRIAELAEIDSKMLADLFADIDTGAIDFELSGYTEDEYKDIATALSEAVHDELKNPDDVPDVDETKEPVTKQGDVWVLGGRHRLICGDSTDRATLDKLMEGKKADLVFTDPPYGMKKENEGVTNDNLNYDDLLEFNKQWIPLTFEALKDNGSWYCWGTDEPLMDIYSEILKPRKKLAGQEKLTFRNLITWDKGNGQGQLASERRSYATADEKCLFIMMGRQTYGDTCADYWEGFEPIRQKLIQMKERFNLSTADVIELAGATTCSHWFSTSQWEFPSEQRFMIFAENLLKKGYSGNEEYKDLRKEYDERRQEYEDLLQEYNELRQEFYNSRAYFDNTHDNMNNVWHFARTTGEERETAGGHATPKPIALCCRAIRSSSREEEIVLDVFGGSGSTLIACEQERRKCRMIELEPKWCDVIVKRYVRATGDKNIKCIRNGEELPRAAIANILKE